MQINRNSRLTARSQELRKNMTREERHLWYDFLKDLPVPVKRQKVIGNYIVDFYIPAVQLAIELDGSQHYEQQGREYDDRRDAYIKSLGCSILRYANSDINSNFQGVCEDILSNIQKYLPLKKPSPLGEGGSPKG